jgi:hypothetical protein
MDRSVGAMRDILDRGRGRMPAFVVDRGEPEALCAFLEWVCTNRADLVDLNNRVLEREEFSWSAVPWFEYK